MGRGYHHAANQETAHDVGVNPDNTGTNGLIDFHIPFVQSLPLNDYLGVCDKLGVKPLCPLLLLARDLMPLK